MPLSSGAEVRVPRTEAAGVADAMIEAGVILVAKELWFVPQWVLRCLTNSPIFKTDKPSCLFV